MPKTSFSLTNISKTKSPPLTLFYFVSQSFFIQRFYRVFDGVIKRFDSCFYTFIFSKTFRLLDCVILFKIVLFFIKEENRYFFIKIFLSAIHIKIV